MSPGGGNRWEPLWIGEPQRRRYAAFHPAGHGAPAPAVLIVPPLLHEQPRSRRLLTEVADRLSALGIACMRFDYFGTGDSGGRGEQVDFTSMRDDLALATNSLRSMAGTGQVAALAVRGGSLPLASWLDRGGDAQYAVLWEPIMDGARWLAELERADADELRSTSRYVLRRGDPVAGSERQLMGFDVSPDFRKQLAAVQVMPEAWPRRPLLWGMLSPGAPPAPSQMQRIFELPADVARIGGSTRMDGALFVSPGLRGVIDALGEALLEQASRQRAQTAAVP